MEEIPFLVKSKPFLGIEASYDEVEVVVFGVPYDLTSSWRPGARYGPDAIREASYYLELASYSSGRAVSTLRVFDLGDVAWVYSLSTMLKRCNKLCKRIRSEGKFPIMLGGEHTLSLATTLACSPSKLVVFDAHLDLRDSYLDRRVNHATWLRRLLERMPEVRCMVIGARGYEKEEVAFAYSSSVEVVRSSDVAESVRQVEERVKSFVDGEGATYVSLDVDVLDPGIAPGVSTPEPGGLEPHAFFRLLSLVCSAPNLVGADVVEVNPLFDNGQAANYAAKAIIELLVCRASQEAR